MTRTERTEVAVLATIAAVGASTPLTIEYFAGPLSTNVSWHVVLWAAALWALSVAPAKVVFEFCDRDVPADAEEIGTFIGVGYFLYPIGCAVGFPVARSVSPGGVLYKAVQAVSLCVFVLAAAAFCGLLARGIGQAIRNRRGPVK